MFLIPVFYLVIILPLYGKEIIYSDENYRFKLHYDSRQIKITGSRLDLSLTQSKCNNYFFLQFQRQVDQLFEGVTFYKTRFENTFEITVDKTKYYALRNTKFGNKIRLIPFEFQRLKLEDKFKCSLK